ncbi:hypothetical protein E4A41_07390, partial [Micrococcus endophyticus]
GGGGASRTITLCATEDAPYQEPVRIAERLLAERGWELKTTFVTDIIQPNIAVDRGEFDANFFQHIAHLKQFNADNGTSVVPAFNVYTSPAGLFSTRYSSLEELPDGARISVPVDPSNNGRALRLLAQAGRITVREGVSVIRLSQHDITANPHGYEFVEVDQQSLALTIEDADAGFLFARQSAKIGLPISESLLFETAEDAVPFRVVVATREASATPKPAGPCARPSSRRRCAAGTRTTSTAPSAPRRGGTTPRSDRRPR